MFYTVKVHHLELMVSCNSKPCALPHRACKMGTPRTKDPEG